MRKGLINVDIILILVIAVIIRLYFFNGIRGHDDWVYLFYIRSYINGITEEMFGSLWGMRLVLLFPIITLFNVFGPSLFLAFLPTFTLSILEIILVYIACIYVFNDKKTALLSALLLSIFPLDVFVSTTIRSDTEVGFYVFLSLFLFVLAQKFSDKRSGIFLFLSGLVAAISYSVKELSMLTMVGFFGIFAIESISKRRVQWKYGLIVLGFILFISAESLFYKVETGNWLQRFDKGFMWYTRIYERGDYKHDQTLSKSYIPCLLLNLPNKHCTKITTEGDWNNTYTSLGYFYYFVFLSMVYIFLKKDTKSYVFILWIIIVLLYFEFGTMSLFHFVNFHKEPRYFTIISAASMIVFGRGVALFLEEKRYIKLRITIVAIVIIFLSVQSVTILQKYHKGYVQYIQFNDQIYDFLKDKKNNIWTDSFVVQYLELKTGYKFWSDVHKFKGESDYGILEDTAFFDCNKDNSGSYVVLTRESAQGFYENLYKDERKRCLVEQPSNWVLVKRIYADDAWASIYYIHQLT